MPPIEVIQAPEVKEDAPTTQPIVGIIYPPPEVRNIVDKTASFVARNGPEFEARIRQNEIGNPKFNFLNFGDPYHAYYLHKVKDFKEGKNAEIPAPGIPLKPILSATAQKQQEFLKQATEQPFIPKDPPVEFEFIVDAPSICAIDLDIVKLTAEFAVRNGRQFLVNLMNREQRNFQFDFLRPQHSLFQYFLKVMKQYTKILIPPKDMMFKLKEESSSMTAVLEQVKYRAEWIKYQEAQLQKAEEEVEKDRVAYAQIDWHDFVVVETVDYQPYEVGNFPAPTTPDEVGARVLLQERIEDGDETEMQIESEEEDEEQESTEEEIEESEESDHEEPPEQERQVKEAKDNIQVQDMEEVSDTESEDESEESKATAVSKKIPAPPPPPVIKELPQPPPLPPSPDKIVVKKGYNPKQAVKTTRPPAPDEVLISPLTSEKIPASKVQEHMRIGLLDPRWVEQRDRHIQDKMNQETVYAPGSAIEASLKQLAERRTDIFGVGDEETAIGKKIGEEDKKKEDKVTWDGHTSSVEAATRAARANITLEEQIHQIHKVKGLLPDEEKEKIGPKPVVSSASPQKPQPSSQTIIPKPLPPPPKPLPPPPVPVQAPVPPPPPPGPMPMPPMGGMPPPPPGLMPPQPPMMMMPMRPPMMVPGRPPFPVSAPAPPMPGFMPPPAPQMQPPPPQPPPMGMKHPSDMEDEQPNKKLRTEESLIPEQDFLRKHKGNVVIKVACPIITEKAEWRLKGQLLSMNLPLTDAVAVIKAKIHDETGMPPGKQKIHWEGLFLKDSNSLAYYNLTPGTMLQLQLKERGGRKK